MILDCQCGEKKFVVPDNAIPAAGRLVQCSYCGNKWTQFPITKKVTKEPINFLAKKEVIEKPAKVQPKIQNEKIFSTPIKKKKMVKKRSGPSIYSKEYLEKKHGISIDKTSFVIQMHILGMFLPSLFTGNLIKKHGHNKIMYLGILILFLCILLNFIDQGFYNYLFALILLGIGWNFLFISGTSLLMISYEPHEKFKSQGLNDFIVFSTQATGALSAGFLLNLYNWKVINLLCIPLLIMVFLVIYRSNNKKIV